MVHRGVLIATIGVAITIIIMAIALAPSASKRVPASYYIAQGCKVASRESNGNHVAFSFSCPSEDAFRRAEQQYKEYLEHRNP